MNRYIEHEVLHWMPSSQTSSIHRLVAEEPLSIQVQGHPFHTGDRTPGEEIAHAAGYCLAEGIVDTPDDIESVEYADPSNINLVNVRLTEERWEKVRPLVTEKSADDKLPFGCISQDVIDAACSRLSPLPDGIKIDVKRGLECPDELNEHQPLRSQTHATHATAVYSPSFERLTVSEDVGRHNGMDKAIGRLFLDRRLDEAGVLVLSSRISFELVQKAVRARIPVIFSVSRPTGLAVGLASRLNMTLACLAKKGGGFIFCGHHRLRL